MADRNTIIQRITLEGADAIIKALASVGDVGEKAFDQVKEAANAQQLQKIADTFDKIGAAGKALAEKIGGVKDNFENFGGAVLNVAERVTAISAIAAAAGLSVLGLARSAGTAANEVQEQAQAMGLTIEAYQRLQFAADQAGVAQKQFSSGLSNFSKAIQASATEQKKTIIDLASDVAAALGGEAFNTVRTGQIQAALDNVIPAAKQIQAQLKALGSNVSLQSVITQLRNMALNSEDARVKLTQLGSKVPAATLTEALARAKQGIGDLSLVTNSAGQALNKLGISVLDTAGKTRSTDDVLADVAAKFKAMDDGSEKTALAIALFGKRAGPDLIPLLNQGKDAIASIGSEMFKLGGGFDATQVKAGKDMVDAFGRLQFAVTAAKNQLGIIFTPILTQAADALTGAIRNNFETIKGWAVYLGNTAKPILMDFIAALSGRDADVQNTWIIRWRDNIKTFVIEMKTAILGTVIPVFTAIGDAADWVAGKINSFFGTDYTGKGLLLVTALGSITGAFGLIIPAITLVTSLVFGFFTLLAANPFALLVIAAFALGAAIVAVATNVGGLRDKLVELVTSAPGAAWQWLVDTYTAADQKVSDAMGRLVTTITTWVTTGIAGAWQWLSDGFDAVVVYIQGKFQGLLEYLRSLGAQIGAFFGFGGGQGNNGQAAGSSGSSGFASGGAVVGPGSGTSDSILARLSNGEFVQRAAAVKHYGLAFMHAVNTLQFKMPKFALGGLVDRINVPSPTSLLPRFADGGAVRLAPAAATGAGLHPVTLDLGGGRKVGGLFAAPDAVTDLRKAAFLQQISATGKRSSSVG